MAREIPGAIGVTRSGQALAPATTDDVAEGASAGDARSCLRSAALEGFGAQALPAGSALSELEEAVVPLYLFHRYQVEAVGKLVGGVDYRYAVRGDGGPTAVELVAPERQREALDARDVGAGRPVGVVARAGVRAAGRFGLLGRGVLGSGESEQLEEGLLNEVLRALPVADRPEDEVQQPLVISLHELGERPRIADE